jgi:hypothetical protein
MANTKEPTSDEIARAHALLLEHAEARKYNPIAAARITAERQAALEQAAALVAMNDARIRATVAQREMNEHRTRYLELRSSNPVLAARYAEIHPEVYDDNPPEARTPVTDAFYAARDAVTSTAAPATGTPSDVRRKYQELRQSNPILAARYAANHPETYEDDPPEARK